jgi:hypothetical protein
MLTHQLQQLAMHEEDFTLQFTVDRRNAAVLDLNRSIAECVGMKVIKKSGVLPLVEDSEEELYMMVPQMAEGTVNEPDFDFEHSDVMAGAA